MLLNLCKVLGVMNQERATRPRSQAVKTLPFHGSDTGSIPVGVIRKPNSYTTMRAQAAVSLDKLEEYSIVGSKNHTMGSSVPEVKMCGWSPKTDNYY